MVFVFVLMLLLFSGKQRERYTIYPQNSGILLCHSGRAKTNKLCATEQSKIGETGPVQQVME